MRKTILILALLLITSCTSALKEEICSQNLIKEELPDNAYFYVSNNEIINSMHPTFQRGYNYTMTKVNSGDEVNIGDIIFFRVDDELCAVVHRVVDIKDGKYITKGDFNLNNDKFYTEFDDIYYKVEV